MFDPYDYEDEREGIENSRGNHVCRDGSGDILATVFSKGPAWQIIINRNEGGMFVANEGFDDTEGVMERADAILGGAGCTLTPVTPAVDHESVVTVWKTQKTTSNGSPTYGGATAPAHTP